MGRASPVSIVWLTVVVHPISVSDRLKTFSYDNRMSTSFAESEQGPNRLHFRAPARSLTNFGVDADICRSTSLPEIAYRSSTTGTRTSRGCKAVTSVHLCKVMGSEWTFMTRTGMSSNLLSGTSVRDTWIPPARTAGSVAHPTPATFCSPCSRLKTTFAEMSISSLGGTTISSWRTTQQQEDNPSATFKPKLVGGHFQLPSAYRPPSFSFCHSPPAPSMPFSPLKRRSGMWTTAE